MAYLGNNGCGCGCGDSKPVNVEGGETPSAKDIVSAGGVVTTDVKISKHPENLLSVAGDGLLVRKEDCRSADGSETRIEAGAGADLTGSGTWEDPYIVSFGGGGESGGGDAPKLKGGETETAADTVKDGVVTTDVKLSDEDGNALEVRDGGLYVPAGDGGGAVDCDEMRKCVSAGDGLTYDPKTGVFEAKLSGDDGNTIALGDDGGLFVPAGTGGGPAATVKGGESPTAVNKVDADGSTFTVTPEAKVSKKDGNAITAEADGLYVPAGGDGGPSDIAGGETQTAKTTVDAGKVTADVKVSPKEGNTLSVDGDGGLFVAPASGDGAPVTGGETPTIKTTVDGGKVTGDTKISAADGNVLKTNDDGLFVPAPTGGGDGGAPLQGGKTPTATTTVKDGTVTADVIVSPDKGNALKAQDNGLFVPEKFFQTAEIALTSITDEVDINTFNVPVDGTGHKIAEAPPLEFVNPSPVLPMHVVVDNQLEHAQFRIFNGNVKAVMGTRLHIEGDVTMDVESHQQFEDHNVENGPRMWDSMGAHEPVTFTIPPGGKVTMTMGAYLAIYLYDGKSTLFQARHRVTAWGGN
ncbi:hypothetical protein [Amycolatopsis sp. DSM 110486]|uniref:hypothetical protein n=1 Tax=Amycolatopsis sp. DSM 110486 TaxID=2865832 RepID=UPI001C69CA44|nr:hypothetical protein [Amycolatopsis sp. DSM 110486]QYN17618.1 hypothetical protein K1T34_33065 [Amycolatopsis sp. DSM 110486]